MARKTSPTYIVELALHVSPEQEREMLIRLELARRIYNACLGEALRRLDAMRGCKAWHAAQALPKTVGKKLNKERREAFLAVRHKFGFTSAAISAYGTQCKNESKWNEGRKRTDPRLGAHETQRVAERAFAAVEQHAFGVRGRPRFKNKYRPLHSLEGKSEDSSIYWDSDDKCLEWGALRLPALLPPEGRDPWLEEALGHRTKYARVVWRRIKGRRRWFVQLAQEGRAPQKYRIGKGTVGLDVGPSTIAVYSEKAAALIPLATEVEQPWKEVRRLQRKLDRSRRATNPKCYNADGTFKQGSKIEVRSNRYQKLREELAETERVLAKTRDRSHGRLANRVLGLGCALQAEKLSYKAFQKSYGRSTKVRAAGSLMSKLRRKAESANGELRDLNTWTLRLSQYDHLTGTYAKKPLSERWHVLGDGSGVVQRDLYSAFLAAYADRDHIQSCQVHAAWPVAQSLLGRAGWMREQPVSVESLLKAAPALPTPERVARQRASADGDSPAKVASSFSSSRAPEKAVGRGLRTPCL